MIPQPIKTRLQEALNSQLPPQKVKLWPEIHERLVKINHPLTQTQGTTMTPTYSRTLRPAFLAFALLALLTLAFLTPPGRALAQSILQYFTRAGTDNLPLQPEYTAPVEAPRNLSLEEAQTQAGFNLRTPASLPEGFTFQGASYTPETRTVIQQFGYNSAEIRFSIAQQPYTTRETCDLCGLVGASASVQTIQIGAISGEYTEGVWELTDNGPVWP